MSSTIRKQEMYAGDGLRPHLEVRARQSALRAIALVLARYEIRSVRRLFEEFERDILLPILLGEIAFHNIGRGEDRLDANALADEDVSNPDEPPCTLKPCNAYSIAAATGLPRETVRRKINRLVELGWISRRRNGHLYVSPRAIEHFGTLLCTRELGELLETADRVRKLIQS